MEDRQLFLDGIRDLFDETEPEDVQFETSFRELDEWSSLIVLTLIVHFEDNYKTKLTPDSIEKSNTILDLYNLIHV